MIPPIIHYCWFGNTPIPDEFQVYIKEWKNLLPDFQFKLWTETNSPMNSAYCKTALAEKNWANLSNFVRLFALSVEGGIYLDTDIKLLKPIYPLLEYKCFLGFEKEGENYVVNNAVFGSVKNHPFVNKCLQTIETDFDGKEKAYESAPVLITRLLKENYHIEPSGTQHFNDLTIFDQEHFYPIHWSETYKTKNYSTYITANTYTLHVWQKSWFSHDMLINTIDNWQEWAHDLKTQNEKLHQQLTTFTVYSEEQFQKETVHYDEKINELKELLHISLDEIKSVQKEFYSKSHSFNDDLNRINTKVETAFVDTLHKLKEISLSVNTIQKEQVHLKEAIVLVQNTANQQKLTLYKQQEELERISQAQKNQESRITGKISGFLQQSVNSQLGINGELQSLKEAISQNIATKDKSLKILATSNIEYKSIIERLSNEAGAINNTNNHLKQRIECLEDSVTETQKNIIENQTAIQWYIQTYERRTLIGLIKQWFLNKLRRK